MLEKSTRALIENILAKRMVLQSTQGIILRVYNREKYNWLFSVYFDPEVSHYIYQACNDENLLKDINWVNQLISRLLTISKDSVHII